MEMKALVDIKSIKAGTRFYLFEILRKLKAEMNLIYFIFGSDDLENKYLVHADELFADEMIAEDADVDDFHFYFSSTSELPEIIRETPKIISVAVLLDVFERVRSVEEKWQWLRDGAQYWKKYDYYVSPIDYRCIPAVQKYYQFEQDKMIVGIKAGQDKYELLDAYEDERTFLSQYIDKLDARHIAEELQSIVDRICSRPKVTIVTITLNLIKNKRVQSIEQCLESVQKQTYENIEHLIIDGASKDKTLDLLAPHEKAGKITIYSEPDKGLYDAMNKGIARATGKYIVFLNSDDCYCDNKAVEDAVTLLEKHGADYLFGNAWLQQLSGEKELWDGNLNGAPYAVIYCHQSMFVNLDTMRAMGGFDLKYKICADTDLMYRMIRDNKKWCKLNRPYILFRAGGVSTYATDVKKEQTASFYLNIGKDLGLSAIECEELWGKSFLHNYSMDHIGQTLSKLSGKFDVGQSILNLVELHRDGAVAYALANAAPAPQPSQLINVKKLVWAGAKRRIKTALRINVEVFAKNGKTYRKYYVLNKIPVLTLGVKG